MAEPDDALQQAARNDLPCGIVGVAEEYRVPFSPFQARQERIVQKKAVVCVQRVPLHPAACRLQRRGILGKGGRQFQRAPGSDRRAIGKDQLRRAAAAEDVRFRHLLKAGNGGHQLPAEGVWIAVQAGGSLCHRPPDGFWGAQRIGVGGKIQHHRTAVQVAAVGIEGLVKHGEPPFTKGSALLRRSTAAAPEPLCRTADGRRGGYPGV